MTDLNAMISLKGETKITANYGEHIVYETMQVLPVIS